MRVKIIFAVVASVVVSLNIFAENQIRFAPINPDFVRSVSKGFTLTDQKDKKLGLKPSPHDPAIRKIQPLSTSFKKTYGILPSSYDLRNYGRVTSVKDQGLYGNCWAFASIASMESCLLPAETNDFSENHLSNLHGFDSPFGEGGNCYMAMAYFARWAGPVNESEDPYPNPNGSPSGLSPRKHFQGAIMLPDKTSAVDVITMKENLIKYGAYYTSMRWDDSFYNSSTYAFYNPSSDYPNHAVTIVGWNDNFSKNNFITPPPGNGAFLIKNSWGTAWGDNGYFWVSYYDYWIGTENCIFYDTELTNNYQTIYQYDTLGWCGQVGFGSSTSSYAGNIFYVGSGTATIYAVSFYTVVPDMECVIKIYNEVSSNNPVNGTLLLTQTTNYTFAGYHTVILNTPVNVLNRFSVVIKFSSPSYTAPIPIEYPFVGYSSRATASPYESFISDDGYYDGSSWIDCGAQSPPFNVCIKAFGTGSAYTPPAPTVSYSPLLNDFDGDLYGDPALYSTSQARLYVLPSSYHFAQVFSLSGWGGNGYTALAGIFDDDWPEDPILYHSSYGLWYFLSSQSGYRQLYYIQWGGSVWQPVAADFNGDWYVDPTVYKDGWWYVLLSQGNPIVNGYNNYVSGYFYISAASPFGSDVDGDGFADLILHSASNGTWYALLSSSVYTQYVSAQWGGTGASACVGDFDGDLRVEPIVFDNSTGKWRALLSSSGYTQEIQGTWKP